MFNTKHAVESRIESMHETMDRLYKAASDMVKISGQSNLARHLNVSPQVIKNWEARGISNRGALVAQKKFGVSATWIMTGEGEMTSRITEYPKSAQVVQLHAREIDPTPYPPMIREIINFALSMDERGQAQLAERAEVLALRFPAIKANSGQ